MALITRVRAAFMAGVILGFAMILAWVAAGHGEAARTAYDRAQWRHWIHVEGCRDTRAMVLARDARRIGNSGEAVHLVWSDDGCRVAAGTWLDPYTGQVFTQPTDLDVDHVWPLKRVHMIGGATWDRERKAAYANDLTYRWTLIAASAHANRSKGDKGPAAWVPPNRAYWCQYGQALATVAVIWRLKVEELDRAAIHQLVQAC